MTMRHVAATAAVVGGLCWTARWGADLAGSSPGWAGTAYWAGMALLGVALAAVGAGLVRAAWLQVIVGVALPLLVWSVYAVVRGSGEGTAFDGVLGAAALVTGIGALVAGGQHGTAHAAAGRHGTHSAR